jgi:hypothetical protein
MSSEQMERELLELAAKAAGIRLHVWGTKGEENFADLDTHARWNPLTDDGDALRLAVKLRLQIEWDEDSAWAGDQHQLFEWSQHNGDPASALRRAIVRAAAQLAKGEGKV